MIKLLVAQEIVAFLRLKVQRFSARVYEERVKMDQDEWKAIHRMEIRVASFELKRIEGLLAVTFPEHMEFISVGPIPWWKKMTAKRVFIWDLPARFRCTM